MSQVHRVIIASDIHIPVHHQALLRNFLEFLGEGKHRQVILNGDILDLPTLSSYPSNKDDEHYVAKEIKQTVDFIKKVKATCDKVILVPGNHEDRYTKVINARGAAHLKGLIGLSLEEQFRAQGMPKEVEWVDETIECPGWFHAASRTLVRHGHRQAGKYGGATNVATGLIKGNPGLNVVVGHHHRMQLNTQTVLEDTKFGIATPFMAKNQGYAVGSDWQRGFVVLDFFGAKEFRRCPQVQPYLVLANKSGRFSFEGRVYG